MNSSADEKIYRISNSVIYTKKDDLLRIVRLDSDELISLKGLSQDCFLNFDGKKTLLDIRKEAEEKSGKDISEDFNKLIEFLLKFNILEEVNN